ncbi:MAG: hypothetical protein KDA96_11330 [Planctomycetaceae bacterium]|nr:hypothetical protein [Planctomycetaceae bacterium]
MKLFHDGDEAFAAIDVAGHREVWRLGSKAFRYWLCSQYWIVTRSAPNSQALQDAIGVLRGRAMFEGQHRTTAVRISGNDDVIWLDLANDSWQAVRIDAGGWSIVDRPLVAFVRPRGVLPLPTPIRGGSLDELRELVNVPNDTDWILIIAWLVAALRPRGPYPALSINGEQGSAKSTLSRMLRSLIDPNAAALRSAPRDERDLVIAGSNGHVIALENLSKIQDWLSDALCRLSTGGGFGTRELFSDAEERLFEGQRPVLLNGINELCTRSDLLDRAICVSLSAIPDNRRTTESELWQRFDEIRGRVLGALLDAVSQACSAHADVQLETLPRMADFATWIVAAEPALPCPEGAFLRAYQGNRASANESAIESSVLSGPLMELMEQVDTWEGTATELLDTLSELAGDRVTKGKDWPRKPHLLSGELRRIAPNLRRTGIDVEFGKAGGKRFVRLTRTESQNSGHSVPSVQTADDAGNSQMHGGAAGRTADARDTDSVHDFPPDLGDLDAVDAQGAGSQSCSGDDPVDFGWIDDVFQ